MEWRQSRIVNCGPLVGPEAGPLSGWQVGFSGEACAIEFLRCGLRGKSGGGAAALQKGVLRVRFLGADPFA